MLVSKNILLASLNMSRDQAVRDRLPGHAALLEMYITTITPLEGEFLELVTDHG